MFRGSLWILHLCSDDYLCQTIRSLQANVFQREILGTLTKDYYDDRQMTLDQQATVDL